MVGISTQDRRGTVEHGHFHDEKSGRVIDISLKKGAKLSDLFVLPKGAQVHHLDLTLRGTISQPKTKKTKP